MESKPLKFRGDLTLTFFTKNTLNQREVSGLAMHFEAKLPLIVWITCSSATSDMHVLYGHYSLPLHSTTTVSTGIHRAHTRCLPLAIDNTVSMHKYKVHGLGVRLYDTKFIY